MDPAMIVLQDGFIVPVPLCPHFFEAEHVRSDAVGCCRMLSDSGGGFRCRSTSGSLAITRPKLVDLDAVGRFGRC